MFLFMLYMFTWLSFFILFKYIKWLRCKKWLLPLKTVCVVWSNSNKRINLCRTQKSQLTTQFLSSPADWYTVHGTLVGVCGNSCTQTFTVATRVTCACVKYTSDRKKEKKMMYKFMEIYNVKYLVNFLCQ
jgi:hypothetical protein